MSGALDIRHLSVEIAGLPVLTDVVLSITPGSFVGLVGRNGAGKTTLMRAFMAVRACEVKFLDKDRRATPPQARSGLGIGYMPEDRRLVPELTVEQNVLIPAWANGDPAAAERLGFVYGILPEVRGMAPRRALQLSGGQQKLVALARSLMCGRHLLLLDEPFEGVGVGDAAGAVNPFNGEGIAYGYETGRLAAGVVADALVANDPEVLALYDERMDEAYGDYYKLARAFVRVISEPSILSVCVGVGLRIEPLMNELLTIMANLMRNDKKGPAEVAYRALVRLADVVPERAYELLLGERSSSA